MKGFYMAAAASVLMAASSLQASAVEGIRTLPEDNSTVSYLTFVRMTFDGYKQVMPSVEMMNPVTGPVQVINDESKDVVRHGGALPQPQMDNTIEVVFSADMCTQAYLDQNGEGGKDNPANIVIPNGSYTIVIPADAFTLTKEDGTQIKSEEIRLQYTFGDTQYSDVHITVNLPEKPITEIQTVTLDFTPAPETIEINSKCSEKIGLWDFGGLPMQREAFKVEIADGKATCTLSKPYYKEGNFKVIVPLGFFLINGQPSFQTETGVFQIVNSESDNFTLNVDPAPGTKIEDIFQISMTWVGSCLVDYSQTLADFDETGAYFLRDGDPEEKKIKAIAQMDFSKDDFTILFQPEEFIETDGIWRLFIPDGDITVNGKNAELPELNWQIGDNVSVKGVEAVSDRFDIYNAQGIVVLRGATERELRALPSGLYIAGGRKVVVK